MRSAHNPKGTRTGRKRDVNRRQTFQQKQTTNQFDPRISCRPAERGRGNRPKWAGLRETEEKGKTSARKIAQSREKVSGNFPETRRRSARIRIHIVAFTMVISRRIIR